MHRFSELQLVNYAENHTYYSTLIFPKWLVLIQEQVQTFILFRQNPGYPCFKLVYF